MTTTGRSMMRWPIVLWSTIFWTSKLGFYINIFALSHPLIRSCLLFTRNPYGKGSAAVSQSNVRLCYRLQWLNIPVLLFSRRNKSKILCFPFRQISFEYFCDRDAARSFHGLGQRRNYSTGLSLARGWTYHIACPKKVSGLHLPKSLRRSEGKREVATLSPFPPPPPPRLSLSHLLCIFDFLEGKGEERAIDKLALPFPNYLSKGAGIAKPTVFLQINYWVVSQQRKGIVRNTMCKILKGIFWPNPLLWW